MSVRRRLEQLERKAARAAPPTPRTVAFDYERYVALWREHPVSLDEWKTMVTPLALQKAREQSQQDQKETRHA